ncbi:uncharacterized protein ISCGN_001584 [Ixodes scapularis]
MLRASHLLLLTAALIWADYCDVDSRSAIFHANAVGRATSYFFKNCSKILYGLSKKPTSQNVISFSNYVCARLSYCEEIWGEDIRTALTVCMVNITSYEWGLPNGFTAEDNLKSTSMLVRSKSADPVLNPTLTMDRNED